MAKNKIFVGMSKVAIAAVLTTGLAAGFAGNAQAAEYDLYNKDGKIIGNLWEATLDNNFTLLQDILDNGSTYTYETDGKVYNFNKANEVAAKYADLSTAEKNAKIAEELKDEAKPIPSALAIKSVDNIDVNGVDISITPLIEDKAGVTVEVINGAGQKIEVESQDILAGVTAVNFKFKTPVKSEDLDGIWKVNGVAHSFTDIKLVANINAAVGANNQVDLLAALKAANIKNVDESKIAVYLSDINGAAVKSTIADIQKIVDDRNASDNETTADSAIFKSVQEAKTQVAVLNILKANFERVNPAWIVEYTSGNSGAAGIEIKNGADNVVYKNDSNTTGNVKADIQIAIDAVNDAKIVVLEGNVTTSVGQAEITGLLQTWMKDDVAPATTKADTIKASQVKEAVFKVQEATTQNALYSALVGLSKIDSTNLDPSALNAKLAPEYLTLKKTLTPASDLNSTANIKTNLVTATDTKAVTDSMTDITAKFTALNADNTNATKKADFKASLQKLADVTAHKTGADKFDMSKVSDANLVKYSTEFAAPTAIDASSTVANVTAKINTVNDAQGIDSALVTINDSKSTASQVKDALVEISVARNSGGAATDAKAFINLSSQAKLEIAQLVIDARPASPGYANLDAIIATADGNGAIKTQQAAHTAKIAKFNAIGNLASASTVATKDALDDYGYENYTKLSTTQKVSIASEINKLTKDVSGTATALDFSGNDAVKTLKAANDIIDAAIAKVVK